MVDRLQLSLSERDQLVDQLGAREQTMRRFLADASHELRTPLTAIRGGAQVLLLGSASDPAELAESLGHIQAQAERMSRLVADLLLLSRREGTDQTPGEGARLVVTLPLTPRPQPECAEVQGHRPPGPSPARPNESSLEGGGAP